MITPWYLTQFIGQYVTGLFRNFRLLGGVSLLALILLNACSLPGTTEEAEQSPFDTPPEDTYSLFVNEVQPVLNKRCVVCHACYDAPCQLKLGSYEGVTRGASKVPVYDGERLFAAEPTRLFLDAELPSQWRQKGFHPVLNESASGVNANVTNSVLASMLALKKGFPSDANKPLDESFEFDINRELQCPTMTEFEHYQKDKPLWGMPYGLPAITDDEQGIITDWIANGSPQSVPDKSMTIYKSNINQWEEFLNQGDNKSRLVARYLYEHLFIAHIYFETSQDPSYFQLVRSATPPGQPIDIIATRRPFSEPNVDRVYYRLTPVKSTIVDKLHMPILLDDARLTQWQEWFITPDYPVDTLPGYAAEVASNPFVAFAQLPVAARYRFMLSEAQYTIMQFIKGPVCRGQIALNVINDYFWVVFIDPSTRLIEHQDAFLEQARHEISLPAEAQSNALPTNWIAYAAKERNYLKTKSEFLNSSKIKQIPIDLNLIWDGDDGNDNVGLTIFRHNDAASVVKGLVGEKPQTAWVISYPLFERIHYLLVAGYDVYGNLGHQLNSRMYMDFLRMEGEFNFLTLLPQKVRQTVWDKWYRGSVSLVSEYVQKGNYLLGEPAIHYQTEDPLNELYSRLKTKVSPALNREHELSQGIADSESVNAFKRINQVVGIGASLLPQSSIIMVEDSDTDKIEVYTLLRNNAYTNISHLFSEDERRLPKEDTLIVTYDLATSHPNLLFYLPKEQLGEFAHQITSLKNAEDVQQLYLSYGVRRTDPSFWQKSDKLHQWYKQQHPIRYGWLDYNRLLSW
jgi:hypothetical protein